MNSLLQTTTKEEQKIARSSISGFEKTSGHILKLKKKGINIQIQETGDFLTIPKKALEFLLVILNNMAQGNSITLIPSDSEVSTQQAADMLNVSRPHLVKLLESGAIPFTKVGSHRRIRLSDLILYDQHIRKIRTQQLEFLAKQAQELNLGYE